MANAILEGWSSMSITSAASMAASLQSAWRLPPEEKREQELRSLRCINDNFLKFVITEDAVKRYQDDSGVVFMNIYDFLLDENSLQIKNGAHLGAKYVDQ